MAPFSPHTRLSDLRPLWKGLLFSFLCLMGAEAGIELSFPSFMPFTFWPPAGLLVAALILTKGTGRFFLLSGAVVAELVSHTLHHVPPPLMAIIVSTHVLEALCAVLFASLIARTEIRLRTVRETVGLFIGSVVLGAGVATLIGTGALSMAMICDPVDVWNIWWPADALGIVAVTPVVLIGSERMPFPLRSLAPSRLLETAALLVVTIVISSMAFFIGEQLLIGEQILIMIPLLWASLRYSSRMTSVVGMCVAVSALWGSVHGSGVFSGGDVDVSIRMLSLQALLATAAFVGHTVSSFLNERSEIARKLADNETKFRLLAENSTDLISRHAADGRFLYVSPSCRSILGFEPAELLGVSVFDLLHTDDLEHARESHRRMLESRAPSINTYRIRRKDGAYRWVETTSRYVCDPTTGIPGEVHTSSRDVTARRQMELALQRANRALRTTSLSNQELARAGSEADLLQRICRIAVHEGQYRFAWVCMADGDSGAGRRVAAMAAGGTDGVGKIPSASSGDAWCSGPVEAAIQSGHAVIVRGTVTNPQYELWQDHALHLGFVSTIALPLKSDAQTLGALAIISNDHDAFDDEEVGLLTELADNLAVGVARQRERQKREAVELTLHETEHRLAMFFRAAPTMITLSRLDTEEYLDVNEAFEHITGYTRGEAMGRTPYELHILEDTPDREELLAELQLTGEVHDREQRYITKTGDSIVALVSGVLVHMGGEQCVLSVANDITERKHFEERLEASLHEKDILITEIHHRVKNNMQIISSLLGLQARGVHDPEAVELLSESRNRVRSMALIHEKLYQSRDFACVNFGNYLRELGGHLVSMNTCSEVALDIETDDIQLEIDKAIPCGLIVNELVTNALKHGFADGRGGTLRIAMNARPDCLVLEVQDDGAGFPRVSDFRNVASLGLQLVEMLTRQLHGTVRFSRDQGTRFAIEFPRAGERRAGLSPGNTK